jgi:hypothetical protein
MGNGRRINARSAKRKCKPGRWDTEARASAALDRIAQETTLMALGMRTYWCNDCGKYHIGRAGRTDRR